MNNGNYNQKHKKRFILWNNFRYFNIILLFCLLLMRIEHVCHLYKVHNAFSALCTASNAEKSESNLFLYTQCNLVSSISTKKLRFLECMLSLQDLLWQQYGMCMCDTTMTVWHRRTFLNDPAKSVCLNFSLFCFVFLTVLCLSYIYFFLKRALFPQIFSSSITCSGEWYTNTSMNSALGIVTRDM